MYLSRLRLHPRDPLVVVDLGDPAQLHRTIMRAFPQHDGPTPRASLGVLFRVERQLDSLAPPSGPVVLVQAAVQPDWSALPEGYLLGAEVRPVDGVDEVIVDGAQFTFRLVGSPSQKVSTGPNGTERSSRHSRRVGLTDETAQLGWLVRQATLHGFAVDPSGVRTVDLGFQRSNALLVRSVLFEGQLEVRDADRLRSALRGGIGPAKAYGCGLLSLAPARTGG